MNKSPCEMIPSLTEETISIEEEANEIIGNNDIELEANNSVSSILCADLYIVGRLWMEALKTALVGFNILPVVEAAKVQEAPQKPPSMKYTDLPLYSSPHYEYKDYVEDSKKCPDANVKLMHRSLLPHVKCYREKFGRCLCEAKCLLNEQYIKNLETIRRAKRDFKQTMRDPNNLPIRQATVAIGGTAGYLVGSGGGIPRRIFFTSLGFLTAGALCFPKETDEVFRDVAFNAGKFFVAVYNQWCGKNFVMRERLPCKDDLPPNPPNRKPIPCPPNK